MGSRSLIIAMEMKWKDERVLFTAFVLQQSQHFLVHSVVKL